jgi:hypothetical protein
MEAPPPTPASDRAIAALFVVVGVVTAAIVTRGVWADPTRGLVGDWTHPDMLSNHWVYTWVAEQLATGGSLLHNDRYYHPVGDAPFLAGNASGAVLAAPFLWALGHPLGLDVYLLGVLAANVVAGAALARAVGARPVPAAIGGVAFGLCPYLLTELSAGRFAQVPAWELAGGLALWIGALERASIARGAGAGLLIGLAGVEYFYQGGFGGLAAVVLAGAAARAEPARLRSGRWLATVATGAAVAIGTVLPLLLVFLRGWGAVVGASEAEAAFPHPLALEASLMWTWPVLPDTRAMVPQHVSLVLLALAAWEARRRGGWATGGLAVVGVLGWALSLGPRLLTPDGPADGSHLPFAWLYGAHPTLARFWWPYRHAVLVALAVAALGARALSRVAEALPPRVGLLACAAVAIAVPLELHVRGATVTVSTSTLKPTPPYVAALAALEPGVVIDLPASPELWIGQQHLTLQAAHRHPLFDGHAMWVDRVRPDVWDARVAASSFLTELQRFERGLPTPRDPARAGRFEYDPADIARLRADGLRYVVVWRELFAAPIGELPVALEALLGSLFGQPVVSEDGLKAWDLDRHVGTGRVAAPRWRWPPHVPLGDGSSRLVEELPPSQLMERAP